MNPIVKSTENTTNEPNSENLISENTPLKIKYNKKENIDDDEAKLINLYKSFKLEKMLLENQKGKFE
ncbi:hypothetical protein QJR36_17565 (plasmid) [Paraclostridium sordellii]